MSKLEEIIEEFGDAWDRHVTFKKYKFQMVYINEDIPALFVRDKISRIAVILHLDDFDMYQIRHSDDSDEEPATIERSVTVNYFGTILVPLKANFGGNPRWLHRIELGLNRDDYVAITNFRFADIKKKGLGRAVRYLRSEGFLPSRKEMRRCKEN